ncbi:MAG: hypothetical protein ACRELB_27010, partial [Polyangiaceae bacterium]
MPRSDDAIDPLLAKRFAWRFAPPGETPDVGDLAEESSPSAAPPVEVALAPAHHGLDEEALAEQRARLRSACEPIAFAVAEAWALTSTEERLAAVKRLLARATRLGMQITGMEHWPLEAVRLLRLLAQHAPQLTRRQRDRAASLSSLVPLDHAETAELLVEIARTGNAELCDALFADEEWTPEVGDESALVARLADVVDDGPTHASRCVAIEIIARFAPG